VILECCFLSSHGSLVKWIDYHLDHKPSHWWR